MGGRGYAPPGHDVVRRTHASSGDTRIRRSPTSRDGSVSCHDAAQNIHDQLALYWSISNDEKTLDERFDEEEQELSHVSR